MGVEILHFRGSIEVSKKQIVDFKRSAASLEQGHQRLEEEALVVSVAWTT